MFSLNGGCLKFFMNSNCMFVLVLEDFNDRINVSRARRLLDEVESRAR